MRILHKSSQNAFSDHNRDNIFEDVGTGIDVSALDTSVLDSIYR